MRLLFFLLLTTAGLLTTAIAVNAENKAFLLTPQVCQIVGGRASISVENEDYYTELVGPLSGKPSQMCIAGWFGARSCVNVTLYNFKAVCRGGTASAPALYMALFGNDKPNLDSGVTLVGDQISYIEQSNDLYQKNPRRVAFPIGYAPFPDLQARLKTLNWDASGGYPILSREINTDQRRRITDLFVARGGYVEPFPVSHIARAATISQERPKAPEPQPAPPASATRPAMDNATAFVAAGLVFLVGFLTMRNVPVDSFFGRLVIGVLVGVASSVILYFIGVKDHLTIVSVSVFGGVVVFAVSLFS